MKCIRYYGAILASLLALSAGTANGAIQTLPTATNPGDPVLLFGGRSGYTSDLLFGLAIPDGPVIGPPGSQFRYAPAPGFVELDSRITPLIDGGELVGTFYDYVFEFTPDLTDPTNTLLALGSRVVLENSVGGSQNTFEVNDTFRYHNEGFTLAQATWSRAADADLRLYLAGRTSVKFLEPEDPTDPESDPRIPTYDPNTFRLQSDINVSEGNPWSALFYVITDAEHYAVKSNAISVFQAGEEGQSLTEIFIDGFAFTDGAVVPVPAMLPAFVLALGMLGASRSRRSNSIH